MDWILRFGARRFFLAELADSRTMVSPTRNQSIKIQPSAQNTADIIVEQSITACHDDCRSTMQCILVDGYEFITW